MDRRISKLLEGLGPEILSPIPPAIAEATASLVTSDSRALKPGALFVAIAGTQKDGHEFLPEAAKKGAVVSLGENPARPEFGPYIQVQNARKALAKVASAFYGNPSRKMKMIGVTGTSGKTTTTYLIESILKAAGEKAGLVGTIQFRIGGEIIPSTHTTPGPVELQEMLSKMLERGCTTVVMEVSSHALKQHRTDYIAFDGMVFTNLTPEHQDFHPDMEDYFLTKSRLFVDYAEYAVTQGKAPAAAVWIDDPYGERLVKTMGQNRIRGLAYTTYGSTARAQVSGSGLMISVTGIQGSIDRLKIHSPLAGKFNVSNILAAVAVTKGMGFSPQAIENGINQLNGVPGRMERVLNDKGIHVFVDYAHKPDALQNVLATLVELKKGKKLITVMGCGGDRDKKKRPVMGKMAVTSSDFTVVTSDNPRTENPISIIEDILAGIQGAAKPESFQVEPDRGEAIKIAIRKAKAGDIILIAGKGHEDYQIIGTQKIHFDDREVASAALKNYPRG